MRHKKPSKITSRTSSVTNGFVQAIIPSVPLDEAEHKRVMAILDIDPESVTCAYCGDLAYHWDHLNPYVREKRPSGFLNEARNLVPACGPCNTSKSGRPWHSWITGNAKGSPQTRGIHDLRDRIARINALEKELGLKPIDFASYVETALWTGYWERLEEIERLMIEAQKQAAIINQKIREGLGLAGD